MSDSVARDRGEHLRRIPSVHDLATCAALRVLSSRVPRPLLVTAARRVLDRHRTTVARGEWTGAPPTIGDFAAGVIREVEAAEQPPLGAAINATGIIIHTNLGRAPLATEAVEAMAEVAGGYAPVEIDVRSGERGRRSDVIRPLLCELTGCESATVVNNNAAALLIVLSTIAKGRAVLVSRGELIEIGGSFRLPEIMETSGAMLREVGTTNRTRVSDYERALDEGVAAILKVHPSNYRIEGFTESPGVAALTALARSRGVPLVHDIGSGALCDLSAWNIRDEPDARASIADGADIVLFSGDKLLGGPQAGIIVGRSTWIDAIERNPLMRALRVDKITLAALGATLQLHRDADHAAVRIPVLAMAAAPLTDLRARAAAIADRLRAMDGVQSADVIETTAFLGGGAVPAEAIPSAGVRLVARDISETTLAQRLRESPPAVFARLASDAVVMDVRTLLPGEENSVVDAVRRATSRTR
jgi:L-seryl-tRNA(Ser) seleniumtransferase